MDVQEWNRVTSMTQNVKGNIVLNKLIGHYEHMYNLGFQLDFQLVCKDSNFDRRGSILIMTVCH